MSPCLARLRLTAFLLVGLAGGTPLRATPLAPAAGSETGSLSGEVVDPSGAGVPGARVQVRGSGLRRTARTDARGAWTVEPLQAGSYSILVTRDGFAPAAHDAVVRRGEQTFLELALALAPVKEAVTVSEPRRPLGLSAEQSAGAIVIEGDELDALPDDPDELLDALQALAGPAAGPSGGQVFVDGFSGGRIPPKSAIRQIRLNSSPFSAEYDRPGFSRIEILTKPGSERFRGQAQARLRDSALDARDSFAATKPGYRRLAWGGGLGGPIVKGKASFFLDFDRQSVDDSQLVNATVLDANDAPTPFNESLVVPRYRTSFSPRLDAQIGAQTLTLRYAFTSDEQDGTGVGGFSLPSRAYDVSGTQQLLQLGDTIALGKVVNEIRFQWTRRRRSQEPLSFAPALQVQDAFSDGGADIGSSSQRNDLLELHDVASWSRGAHSIRAGIRLRGTSQDDLSRQGFNGTVAFAGTLAPALDANGNVVLGSDGRPILAPISSLERYRRTLLLAGQGWSPEAIRARGGGASQLLISGGDPEASLRQWDAGAFVQDDWKARPDLTLGLGLRLESQSNAASDLDVAPRLSLAWSPGHTGHGAAQTVLRAGGGLFYDRVDESLVLDTRRFGTSAPRRYVVNDPSVLDGITFGPDGGVASLPSFQELGAAEQPFVVRSFAKGLRTPVMLQTSLGLDRALPGGFTLTVSWLGSRTWRALRSRVVSAPGPAGDAAPGPTLAYQYESSGRIRQDQLILGVNRRFGERLNLSARYFLGWARSDTDGAASFPASSSDPAADWGRASTDIRQRLVLTGSVTIPGDLRVSPFLIVSSGAPFNITVGRDLNGDTVFTDRPALADDPSQPDVVATTWGLLDTAPAAGQQTIPRNFGQGPRFATLNLRITKTIALTRHKSGASDAPEPARGPGRFAGPPGMGPRGPGSGFGGGGERRGDRRGDVGPGLSFSLYLQNVFNEVNPGAPVGNLSSPAFGRSLSSAGAFGRGPGGGGPSGATGNRSLEVQVRASF